MFVSTKTEEAKELRSMYRTIRKLPKEKAARVMSFIRAIQDEEPALTDEEIIGLDKAYNELSMGKGESFEEAFKDIL